MEGMAAMPEIVKFGKYRGRLVESLARDAGYVRWLCRQDFTREPWFREKNPELYAIIKAAADRQPAAVSRRQAPAVACHHGVAVTGNFRCLACARERAVEIAAFRRTVAESKTGDRWW